MSRALRLSALLALAASLACATTEPVRAPAPVAAPEVVVEEVAAEILEEDIRPPPTRRRREYLLTEKEYRTLGKGHPRGFQPDDCRGLCKQDVARTPSEDGRWMWTLRCLLKRNLREEPVVSCREDPVDLRPRRRAPVPSTVVLTEE